MSFDNQFENNRLEYNTNMHIYNEHYSLFCNNLNTSLQKELGITSPNIAKTTNDWKPPSIYGLNNSEWIIPEHYFDKTENKNLHIDMFYELTKDIRNLKPLNSVQFEYIKTLSKEKIIELLEIYNSCLQNINKLLEFL